MKGSYKKRRWRLAAIFLALLLCAAPPLTAHGEAAEAGAAQASAGEKGAGEEGENEDEDHSAYVALWLEVRLLIIFLFYVIFLLLQSRRKRKKLATEKQEMTQIVDAVTGLFCRFVLVDLEKDTYVYLEDKQGGIPGSGSYSQLRNLLKFYYIEGEGEQMSKVITREYIQSHLTGGVPYLQFEYQIDLRGRRWENLSIFRLSERDGVPERVLFAIQDVTSLKEREQHNRMELASATREAEAANRAKTVLLEHMSRDIQEPLREILDLAFSSAGSKGDELYDRLGGIVLIGTKMQSLVGNILDLSEMEDGRLEIADGPIALADLIEGVAADIHPRASHRRQNFSVYVEDVRHEELLGDADRVRQVLDHLLDNAVRFTPEGGTVSLAVREETAWSIDRANFEFVCEDDGAGMDREFLDRVFEPFERTGGDFARGEEGAGLGLSVTRGLVELMGGTIQAESAIGAGSRFTVRLELEVAGDAKPQAHGPSSHRLSGKRVLFASGDERACVAVSDMLGEHGIEVEWVTSAADALKRAVTQHEAGQDFGAVILDADAPGDDAIRVARRMRESFSGAAPGIAIASYAWSGVEAAAREAGISFFVSKPLFASRLIRVLRDMLAPWRLLLVEDNELNREITAELLAAQGISVESAEDGSEAVEMMEGKPPEYYDMILMDIQMPSMDGWEATRRIRSLGRRDAASIPIIAMTASTSADDVAAAREAGMSDYVTKPVDGAVLAALMEKWC